MVCVWEEAGNGLIWAGGGVGLVPIRILSMVQIGNWQTRVGKSMGFVCLSSSGS